MDIKKFLVVAEFAGRNSVDIVMHKDSGSPRTRAHLDLPNGAVDLERRIVQFRDGFRSELSEREAELLSYLAARAGEAVSRDELLFRIWHLDPARTKTRTIDMHVAQLRRKLRDTETVPRLLQTVRGNGYLFAGAGSPRPVRALSSRQNSRKKGAACTAPS